jgi:hypothetical protein
VLNVDNRPSIILPRQRPTRYRVVVLTSLHRTRVASCREYRLPVNWKTGYKYRTRAFYNLIGWPGALHV